MDPHRKRKIRLVVALSAAVLLAAALVYTSFSASSEARTPSQLARRAEPGRSYQLTGKVGRGYDARGRRRYVFRVRDRNGTAPRCPSATPGPCPTRSARAARSSSTCASRAPRSSASRTRWSRSARRSSRPSTQGLSVVLVDAGGPA